LVYLTVLVLIYKNLLLQSPVLEVIILLYCSFDKLMISFSLKSNNLFRTIA